MWNSKVKKSSDHLLVTYVYQKQMYELIKSKSFRICMAEECLVFVLYHLHYSENRNIQFSDMFDKVNIDEKWFCFTKNGIS